MTVATATLSFASSPRPPVESAAVEVRSSGSGSVLLHVATPDEHGRVHIDLPEALLTSLFGEDRPHVFFRVWSGDRLLADTEHTLRWNTRDSGRSFRIELADEPRPGKPTPHTVRGRVHASDLGPGWTVEALDQPLRGEPRPIAKAELDDRGAYTLSYTRGQLRPEGRLLADLVLVVRDAQGKERVRSKVLRRAIGRTSAGAAQQPRVE